jgi:anti-sigma regulatory factor (Ser/Thr protein kinase)
MRAMHSYKKQRSKYTDPVLELKLPCELAAVRRGAAQVKKFLTAHGLAEDALWACELALVEGCNNAVQHTSGKEPSGMILVEVRCSDTQVELRINDHTAGFDLPNRAELPLPEAESGRGLYLIQSLMDQVEYVRRSSSNCLILKKKLTGI